MDSIGLEMDDIFGAEEENNVVDIGAVQNEEENPFESNENPDDENTFDANVSAKLAKGAAKKVVRNPQPKLDPQRLAGQRGIAILPKLFETVKFKGKGYEAQDLEKVIKGLEHWAHRLFPKRTFDECLATIEKLGNKKEVKTCIKKIRMDMPLLDEDFVSKPEDEVVRNSDLDGINEAENAFDEMMQTSTSSQLMSPPNSQISFGLPPPSPNSCSKPKTVVLSDELKEKIERNKRLAMERRALRLHNQSLQNQDISLPVQSSQDAEKQSTQVTGENSSSTEKYQILTTPPSTNETAADSNTEVVVTAVVLSGNNSESTITTYPEEEEEKLVTSSSINESKDLGEEDLTLSIPSGKDLAVSSASEVSNKSVDNVDIPKDLGDTVPSIKANNDMVKSVDNKIYSDDDKKLKLLQVGDESRKAEGLASIIPAREGTTVLSASEKPFSDDEKKTGIQVIDMMNMKPEADPLCHAAATSVEPNEDVTSVTCVKQFSDDDNKKLQESRVCDDKPDNDIHMTEDLAAPIPVNED